MKILKAMPKGQIAQIGGSFEPFYPKFFEGPECEGISGRVGSPGLLEPVNPTTSCRYGNVTSSSRQAGSPCTEFTIRQSSSRPPDLNLAEQVGHFEVQTLPRSERNSSSQVRPLLPRLRGFFPIVECRFLVAARPRTGDCTGNSRNCERFGCYSRDSATWEILARFLVLSGSPRLSI